MEKEAEIVEVEEIETAPSKDLVVYNEDNLKHLELVADGIDRFVAAQIKIQNVILKLAKPGDWVIFGDTACLSGPGTERIAAALGISFSDFKMNKEEGQDKIGHHYAWYTTCKTKFGSREIEVVGRCSSRDKFFAKAHGVMKSIEEIDEPNIKMASRRNSMKEGVRIMLGLRNIPISELRAAGVILADSGAKRAEFKKNEPPKEVPKEKKDIADTAKEMFNESEKPVDPNEIKIADTPDGIRKQIGEMLMTCAGGDANEAANLLESITSFPITYGADKGKVVPGKREVGKLSDKQLFTVFGKAKNLLLGGK